MFTFKKKQVMLSNATESYKKYVYTLASKF